MQTVEMPKSTPVGFEEILTDIQRLDNQSFSRPQKQRSAA